MEYIAPLFCSLHARIRFVQQPLSFYSILLQGTGLTASGKFSTQHFRFTSRHSRSKEKGYGSTPVHRLSIFRVLWTLPLPLLNAWDGKAKIISWCVYRNAIQTKINYLPTMFSVLRYITLSIEELDMRDAMPLVAKGRAKLGNKRDSLPMRTQEEKVLIAELGKFKRCLSHACLISEMRFPWHGRYKILSLQAALSKDSLKSRREWLNWSHVRSLATIGLYKSCWRQSRGRACSCVLPFQLLYRLLWRVLTWRLAG